MKQLFTFFFIILIAVVAGLLAHQDSGYVLFGRGYKTVEMSLSLFITLVLLTCVTGYLLIRFIVRTWTMPEKLRKWRQEQQALRSRKIALQGLINLSQGQWKKAERQLTRSVKNSDMPLLNYLSAAKAAQKQNAPDRRDHYLSLAHKSMPNADFSVRLTQAELQFAHGQYEQSLATLVNLQSTSPKHPHILMLLCKLYERLHSWEDLKKLIPDLRKNDVLSEKQLIAIERDTYMELLKATNWKGRFVDLQNFWHSVSKELKKDPQVVAVYTSELIKLEKHDEAEQIIREVLKKEWHPELLGQYGLIKSSHPEKQLSFAESLIKEHEHNPLLLLTLGRLSMHNDLWGKARSYLEASIGHREMPETYKELGLLMEYLNENSLASEYFRKGLLLNNP